MNEEEHDKDIAPALAEIAEIMSANGETLIAYTTYDNGESFTRTHKHASDIDGYSAAEKLIIYAMISKGNIDELMFALMKAHKAGEIDCSQSIFVMKALKDGDAS